MIKISTFYLLGLIFVGVGLAAKIPGYLIDFELLIIIGMIFSLLGIIVLGVGISKIHLKNKKIQ